MTGVTWKIQTRDHRRESEDLATVHIIEEVGELELSWVGFDPVEKS